MCEHWKCYFMIIHFNTWSLGFHWNNLFIMVICFNRELLSPHNWLSKADLRDLNIRKLGSALSEALISFLGRVLRTRWFLRFFSPLILDETFYVCLAPPPAPLEWSWPWLHLRPPRYACSPYLRQNHNLLLCNHHPSMIWPFSFSFFFLFKTLFWGKPSSSLLLQKCFMIISYYKYKRH